MLSESETVRGAVGEVSREGDESLEERSVDGGVSSGFVEVTVTEAAAGGEDAEALDTDWVACRAFTLPLSSTLVSDSEGEAEDVARDGELAGEGVGKAVA